MATTGSKATPPPLRQLQDLLPKITHDELLRLTADALVEIGRRADQYANVLLGEFDDPPHDAANEALAFIYRAEGLMPVYGSLERVRQARRLVREAREELCAALDWNHADEGDTDDN